MAAPRSIPAHQLRQRDLIGPKDVSVDISRSVVGDQTPLSVVDARRRMRG
jgi:hypothetical protein